MREADQSETAIARMTTEKDVSGRVAWMNVQTGPPFAGDNQDGWEWEGIAAQRATIRDPRRCLLGRRVIEQVQEHSARGREELREM